MQVLTKQNTFRFYSSSLLIIYDGADWSRIPGSLPPKDRDSAAASSRSVRKSGAESAVCTSDASCVSPETAPAPETIPPPKIDVRMIDFAHATHQGFLQDKTTHVGPDHGYIFGLQNLIHLFEELKATPEPIQTTLSVHWSWICGLQSHKDAARRLLCIRQSPYIYISVRNCWGLAFVVGLPWEWSSSSNNCRRNCRLVWFRPCLLRCCVVHSNSTSTCELIEWCSGF